ncbi:MAG: RNA methyltransferase [Prevotellaceae bacterium]|jgi:tRNA (guanosine-2'-O-)-methyltransferase|nr:RNA methyltransferase [Prevotellaceae bacterium]
MSAQLIEYLSEFVKEERLEVLQSNLRFRTRYLTVCLEDIYQSQNASAVLRSCDAFGIQDIHIIEDKNKYQLNPMVTRGSSKWLDLHKYNKGENLSIDVINSLREKGYRIVATSPHIGDTSLEDFDLSKGKAALIFGTELTGISQIVEENADEFLKIPMYGFVESLNISVSAAVILHYLTLKLRNTNISWRLGKEEQESLLLQWLKLTIRESEKIIQRYNELT